MSKIVVCIEKFCVVGYEVVEMWECNVGFLLRCFFFKFFIKSYLYVIIFDFEVFGDSNKWKELIVIFIIEKEYVLIFVFIGDKNSVVILKNGVIKFEFLDLILVVMFWI